MANQDKKERIPIPVQTAAEVQFRNDHTCCKCRQNSDIVIHHIDEDRSNNSIDNLAVLCNNCHNDVHKKGVSIRRYLPEEVKKYKEDWENRVSGKRSQQIKLAEEREGKFGKFKDQYSGLRYNIIDNLGFISFGRDLVSLDAILGNLAGFDPKSFNDYINLAEKEFGTYDKEAFKESKLKVGSWLSP